MIKKTLLALMIVIFGYVLPFSAQTTSGISFLKTTDGYLMVNNSQDISFMLEFKGKKFKPVEELGGRGFLIDELLIQAVTASQSEFLKPPADPKNEPGEEQILQLHKDWESNYLSGEFKTKLSVMTEPIEVSPNRKALFWYYAMPGGFDDSFSHQLFLTTVIGKKVLGLNGALKKKSALLDLKNYLVKTMETLKVSDKPFDIKEVSEKLKKGN